MQLQSPKRGTGTRTGHKRLWLRDNTVVDPKSESEFVGEFSKDFWAMRDGTVSNKKKTSDIMENIYPNTCYHMFVLLKFWTPFALHESDDLYLNMKPLKEHHLSDIQ